LGFRQDVDEAIRQAATLIPALTKDAMRGDLHAEYLLGSAYNEGLGVAPNEAHALAYLRQAASKSYALAEWAIANDILRKSRSGSWVDLLGRAADHGAAGAATLYGGLVSQTDPKEAKRRFGQAAGLGDPVAKTQLGNILINETANGSTPCEACRLYREAAEANVPEAQVNFAVCLSRHEVTGCTDTNGARLFRPDPCAEREWLQRAARQRNPLALYDLGVNYVLRKCQPREDDRDRGIELIREAAGQRFAPAERALRDLKEKHPVQYAAQDNSQFSDQIEVKAGKDH
jgi:TPR repeat protein